jgi:hypothetical protein
MVHLIVALLCANVYAFNLPAANADLAAAVELRLPEARPVAAKLALYNVNGVEVAVPHIGGGRNVLAALKPGADLEAVSAKLRAAFGSPAGARAAVLQPQAAAELELAASNPGAKIISLNAFFPPAVAELFNREAGFAGPNCFNAAFTAAGLMAPGKLRHVGNPEADQLLAMYFKPVAPSALKPGDVLVLNDGDHGVFYLGGGLVFHKKSFLKDHIYRIVPLEQVYKPEPFEWKPSPFDGSSPFNTDSPIRDRKAWRPTGAQYQFGAASADEAAKAEFIIFLQEAAEKSAPRWALNKEMGYFTERLLENLVSDWAGMARSANPVLKAYYHRLESLRDQANQSIELELLSSPYSQSHADEILKKAWLPRNAFTSELAARLLKIYGRDPAAAEKALDAIAADYDGTPLKHFKQ